ncbi:acyl-CoA thioesterase [Balneola vulgaris]|jgi:acyl-CoA thioester hydrolase|uniref:acyl-CoA thioesterase n=1 Tax=Balneola vulgaris TaxID=287535 RepID=UPI00036C72F3|nr:thioesterase family protein [Balneola vulgaris]
MDKLPYNEDQFYHWHKIETRFRDLDTLRHVNNANFFTYYEEARIHFLAHYASKSGAEFGKTKSFVLVKAETEFLGQIKYPSTLLVGTGILEVGNSSLVALQAIYDEKDKSLKSMAKTKGVWFDLEKQRPTRLPEIENLDEMLVTLP